MGYAPRKRKDLLDKEIIIEPIKKSFPIGKWFGAVIIIYAVLCITTIASFLIIDHNRKIDGLSVSDSYHAEVCLAYLLVNVDVSTLLTTFFPVLLPQKHFKIGYYHTILQWFPITALIFLFNQQLFCGPKADLLKRKFKYSFIAQFFTVPLLLINTYISSQIYLKISKLRPEYDGDDLYEVIEGSEGSSTKKNDSSERDQKHF